MKETIRDLAITAATVAVALTALARPAVTLDRTADVPRRGVVFTPDRYVVDRIEGAYAVLISDRDMSATDVLVSRFTIPVTEGMAITDLTKVIRP